MGLAVRLFSATTLAMPFFSSSDSSQSFGSWYIRKRAIGLLILIAIAMAASLFIVSSRQLSTVLEDAMADDLAESTTLISRGIARERRKM